MPPTHTDEGVQAAREIRRRFPAVGVLVLSQYAEPDYVLQLLKDGAAGIGYLLKDRIADPDDFGAAVRRVASGGSALDPGVVELIVARTVRAQQAALTVPAPTAAVDPSRAAPNMEQVMLAHAVEWARQHGTGVAREVGAEFVAVAAGRPPCPPRDVPRGARVARRAGQRAGLTYSGSSAQRAGARQSDDRISSRSRMNSFGSLS